jgi:hypothetical protein
MFNKNYFTVSLFYCITIYSCYPSLSPHSIGIISTIAGTGTCTFSGDGGAATSAELCYPGGVTTDSSGHVYISDSYNYRVRKITVSTGIVTTVAGSGATSYSGDGGAATSAGINVPAGLAIDSSGKQTQLDNNMKF